MAKSNHRENKNDQELSKEVAKVLKRLSQEFRFSLIEDHQLFNGLLDHLSPMMIRLSRGIRIENPLTEEIKEENPKDEIPETIVSKLSLLPLIVPDHFYFLYDLT